MFIGRERELKALEKLYTSKKFELLQKDFRQIKNNGMRQRMHPLYAWLKMSCLKRNRL